MSDVIVVVNRKGNILKKRLHKIYRDIMSNSKYQNGKIYKIVDVGFNKCYIGSTCESLSQRMARHRQRYKSYLKGISGISTCFYLFDEYGEENCKIYWIEDCPCNSKKELEAREGHHIKDNECVNKVVAGRTKQEYYKDNQSEIIQKSQNYYAQNKETISSKAKTRYEKDREERIKKVKQYREEHKEKIQNYKKAYRQQHIEQQNEYSKEYRMKNWETLYQKHTCDCGGQYSLNSKATHFKTQKHQNYLKQQSQET